MKMNLCLLFPDLSGAAFGVDEMSRGACDWSLPTRAPAVSVFSC